MSPIICNMTLDGLESVLRENFRDNVQLVRYADDIVIFGDDTPLLVQSVKPLVEKFLSERGLELSAAKTKLAHIENGFSFLGLECTKQTVGYMQFRQTRILPPYMKNSRALFTER